MITFELMITLFVHSSFQQAIQDMSENLKFEVVLALVFIGSILFILFTEGLPVMYSLRSNVVQSLNYKTSNMDHKESIFTSYNTDL